MGTTDTIHNTIAATIADALERLAAMPAFGYAPAGPAATEPTALAALALLAGGKTDAARKACAAIARRQNDDGGVGVGEDQPEPSWTTSLAILAWQAAIDRRAWHGVDHLQTAIRAALAWLAALKGETIPRSPQFGHDTTLVGWPWVAGTHSWIEPTAFAVLALRATGNADQQRCREAVRLLVDRQFPAGGCNYGNTFVFGQELLPHTLPTAIALLALARLNVDDPRVEKSLAWLHEAVGQEQGTPSLCFGLLALAAHDRPHPNAAALIAAAQRRLANRRLANRRLANRGPSGYQLALLAHAALGASSPLVPSPQTALAI